MDILRTLVARCSLLPGLFVVAPGSVAAPEPAAALEAPLAATHLMHVTLGLGAVLVLIVATAWLLRRFFRIQLNLHGQLKILAGLSMGPRERVVLLQVGETQLLLGVAPGRIQTLHVLERSITPSAPEVDEPSPFSLQLGKVTARDVRKGAHIARGRVS